MIIDLVELVELIDKVGSTKIQILESCLKPKHWADLKEITKIADATLHTHMIDLMKWRLLEKDEHLTYLTTEKGIEFLKLQPNVRTLPQGKKPFELFRMAQRGIKPDHFSVKEHLELELLGFAGIQLDKTLNKMYEDVIRAIRESVILWLPQGFIPDKSIWIMINRLIGKYAKTHLDQTNEKITFMIEFDFRTALDMVILDEKDQKIRERLEQNKEEILKRIYKNWHRIFR